MVPSTAEIEQSVEDFVRKTFVYDASVSIDRETSLIGSGTVDSTGILELIGFLEKNYNVRFDDAELVAENFDSIRKIASFLAHKLGA